MSRAGRRLLGLVLAGGLATGASAVVFPQHVASVALVSTAGVVAVMAVASVAVASVLSARDRPRTALDGRVAVGAPGLEPSGLAEARRSLAAAPDGVGLPPGVRDRLTAVAAVRLRRHGMDLEAAGLRRDETGSLVRGDTLRQLTASGRRSSAAPDPARVAGAVHRILDDLDHLGTRPGGGHP